MRALVMRLASVGVATALSSGCVLEDPFERVAASVDSGAAIEVRQTLDAQTQHRDAEPTDATLVQPIADAGDAGPQPCMDDEDCPKPASECQFVTCRDETGACIVSPEPSGTECTGNDGGLRCHAGSCVSCRQDEKENDEETDVDCGGPYCEACGPEKRCLKDSDCLSLICIKESDAAAEGRCAEASCIDGIKNGDEGGPDCGGDCPERCALGVICEQNEDCDSGFCVDGVCCGTACAARCHSCQPGSGVCRAAENGTDPRDECGDSSCDGAGHCAQCTNDKKDGNESDVDCGGNCEKCEIDRVCSADSDCASCVCVNKLCAPPNCANNLHDGCETDIDCGGPCGPFCALGQSCNRKSDCFETFSCQGNGQDKQCVLP